MPAGSLLLSFREPSAEAAPGGYARPPPAVGLRAPYNFATAAAGTLLTLITLINVSLIGLLGLL